MKIASVRKMSESFSKYDITAIGRKKRKFFNRYILNTLKNV